MCLRNAIKLAEGGQHGERITEVLGQELTVCGSVHDDEASVNVHLGSVGSLILNRVGMTTYS